MADMKDIVKLAVDGYKGNVEKYSASQAQDTLREALIAANNGNTTLSYRDIRDGKCQGLFSIIEEILQKTVWDELTNNDYFNALVDSRNIALGDENLFVVKDSNLFAVAEISEGNQAIRRQRIGGATEVSIPTKLKAVRIYEELNRVLAGRVDFNAMIADVSKSFRNQLLNDIYSLWIGATAEQMGGETYFPAAGDYDEDDLLDLIAHVEAAAGGRTATIIGTKKAARKLAPSIMADSAKEDLYDLGYYGKFYGSPVVVTPQRHKVGTTQFVLDDNVLTIVAGDDKPVKLVYEGDPLMIMGDPLTNADLTQEYFYADRWGIGLVLAQNNGIGRYEFNEE